MPEDIILWPDDSWCYREDLEDYTHKSDDYEIIPFETPRWFELDQIHVADREIC